MTEFQIRVLISGLKFELKVPGMRMSSKVNSLKLAKSITKLKTNDKQKQIDALTDIADLLHSQGD